MNHSETPRQREKAPTYLASAACCQQQPVTWLQTQKAEGGASTSPAQGSSHRQTQQCDGTCRTQLWQGPHVGKGSPWKGQRSKGRSEWRSAGTRVYLDTPCFRNGSRPTSGFYLTGDACH